MLNRVTVIGIFYGIRVSTFILVSFISYSHALDFFLTENIRKAIQVFRRTVALRSTQPLTQKRTRCTSWEGG